MTLQETETPMTHKQHYNIYIASCIENGGIYHYGLSGSNEPIFIEKLDLSMPMYMQIFDNKMYTLLRKPFENSDNSGLISTEILSDDKFGKNSEIQSTHGVIACHLAVCGKSIYCVNYLSGNLIKMPNKVVAHSGYGINPQRQEAPHTHFISETPDKKYICSTDLGLDKIFFYDAELNPISEADAEKGCGIRHLCFSGDGKFIYSANELSSTVSVFSYADGKAQLIYSLSTLPESFHGESTASAIRLAGDYLYISNRGHNSIAIFKACGERLTPVGFADCGGDSPRDFNIFGNTLICTNESSDNVTFFEISSGKLIKTKTEFKIPKPLCVIGRQKKR